MTPIWALFSFYDGMSSGEEPPPPPPTDVPRYGPALTERERLKWFSDRRTPFERYEEKKKKEREKRQELGIYERPITKRAIQKDAWEDFSEEAEESSPQDMETQAFLKFLEGLPE